MIGQTNSQIAITRLGIVLNTNQTTHDDLLGATITVTYNYTTKTYIWEGTEITAYIPPKTEYKVEVSSINGYATPPAFKMTLDEQHYRVVTMTYTTEILTINVSSDIDMPSEYTITVSDIGSQTTPSAIYKIPFGKEYTISASYAEGYRVIEDQTFVASQVNRTVNLAYNEYSVIVPTISDAIDLSKQNIFGETISTSTANCYVINTSGTYAFPLVYGNAIKDGASNRSGFSTVDSGQSYTLAPFVNHLDNQILYPFIEDHEGCIASSVELTMSDVNGVLSDIEIVQGGACRYVKFVVNSIPDTGGNCVISILDGNGSAIWSWHIWLWTEDLTPITITNATGVNYNILPVNLASKRDSTGYLINWYYEEFRHVPMLSAFSHNSYWNVDANNYGVKTFTILKRTADTYGEAISNPHTYYAYGSSPFFKYGSYRLFNLWDAGCKNSGTSDNNVIKTIYDPCPVGFKMPSGNTFTGFTEDAIIGEFDYGYRFKRNAEDTIGVLFPATNTRRSDTGNISGSKMGLDSYVWLSSFGYKFGYSTETNKVYPSSSGSGCIGCSVRPIQE